MCSKNKGADQLRGYHDADLRLCFCICKKPYFSRRGSNYYELPTDTIRRHKQVNFHEASVRTDVIQPQNQHLNWYISCWKGGGSNVNKCFEAKMGYEIDIQCSVTHIKDR